MSNLAEYASALHEHHRQNTPRPLTPRRDVTGENAGGLAGVRAVIFDVYGTVINYWRQGFEDNAARDELLLDAFAKIADMFKMNDVLASMNPADPPHKTLCDFYNGLIAIKHQNAKGENAQHAEVRVEEIWAVIVMMLKRNNYDIAANLPNGATLEDFHRYLAYTYNFFGMGRALYPNVLPALKKLKSENIILGILANAQFYTPIDLTLLLRDEAENCKIQFDDMSELFDVNLTFFSYEYGFTKSSGVLYKRLFDALYEYQILPSQTVFVGNDLTNDIAPAASLGMKTALFCGDDNLTLGEENITPDICFEDFSELPSLLSFHGEQA